MDALVSRRSLLRRLSRSGSLVDLSLLSSLKAKSDTLEISEILKSAVGSLLPKLLDAVRNDLGLTPGLNHLSNLNLQFLHSYCVNDSHAR